MSWDSQFEKHSLRTLNVKARTLYIKSSLKVMDKFCNLKQNYVKQNRFYHRLIDTKQLLSSSSISSMIKWNDIKWNHIIHGPAVIDSTDTEV